MSHVGLCGLPGLVPEQFNTAHPQKIAFAEHLGMKLDRKRVWGRGRVCQSIFNDLLK